MLIAHTAAAVGDGCLRRVRAVPDPERQREGTALARQRGAGRGRTRALTADQIAQLRQQAATGVAKATLAREFGISRETVNQYLRAGSGVEQAG
jgi:DNA invertase Pin-like site-specific DNA recombinase